MSGSNEIKSSMRRLSYPGQCVPFVADTGQMRYARTAMADHPRIYTEGLAAYPWRTKQESAGALAKRTVFNGTA